MARAYKCPNKNCKQFDVEIIVRAKKVKPVLPKLNVEEGTSHYVEHLMWEVNRPLYVTYPESVYCWYCGCAALRGEPN